MIPLNIFYWIHQECQWTKSLSFVTFSHLFPQPGGERDGAPGRAAAEGVIAHLGKGCNSPCQIGKKMTEMEYLYHSTMGYLGSVPGVKCRFFCAK